MSSFLETLDFSLAVTGPIFLILMLGVGLRRIGMLPDAFVEGGSRLVFNVALPTLLFVSISTARLDLAAHLPMVAYSVGATLLVYLLLEWLAGLFVEPRRDRGVVIQGAFRSNLGAIGLAYCINAYGQAGLATASLYLGVMTILYNVLAVITLNRSLDQHKSIVRMVRGVATNPLILGILLALPFSLLEIPLPSIVQTSANSIASLTLPLALLCTGAALDFGSLRKELRNTLLAASGKLVLTPMLVTVGALIAGFRGIELGVMMLMASAPTAAAGYVMVRAMGGNATLAANIIALTSLGSLLTTSLAITLLRSLDLM